MQPFISLTRRLLFTCAASVGCLAASSVAAKPEAPTVLCQTFPDAAECAGKVVSCTFCHDSVDPPRWNAYGADLQSELLGGSDFARGLPLALRAIAAEDSDGDGQANESEIVAGTLPGNPSSRATGASEQTAVTNPRYRVAGYDYAFALRRVTTLYCGRSPTYEELQPLRVATDEQAAKQKLHETLAACLASEHWKRAALPRLADKRIRPLRAIGPQSQIMFSGLRLVIGDYDYDYRLWRYVLADDRDMRELLTADYYVVEASDGALSATRAVIAKPDPGAIAGGQPLAPERRAGMITTQWFLTSNTMFSALPRTTAAQAYRAYLGADISSGEGLRPIAGEPVDIDQKNLAQPRCANCHSTLDPLSYAFAPYEGIQISAELRFGDYRPERLVERLPNFDPALQRSYVLGQQVQSVVEWAAVAAQSDEFKRTMAELFFVHALGAKPTAAQLPEFTALWKACAADGYSANRLIHRLVDMHVFGAP
jgi:hypothetical protein